MMKISIAHRGRTVYQSLCLYLEPRQWNKRKGCKDYRSFYMKINPVLKRIAPGVTTYWARHSWATIAASLDIPKETIAHALGHAQSSVTDIYIEFDERKVDAANRRVIDRVFGISKEV